MVARRGNYFSPRERARIKHQFIQLSKLRVHPPSGTLFEQLDFAQHVEEVFKAIRSARTTRQVIIEAWLLVDHVVTYFLRDGLQIPERIDDALSLVPWSFENKLKLLKVLIKEEGGKLPNQKSYLAFELHPEFHSQLIQGDPDLYERLATAAQDFESSRCPDKSLALMRNSFAHTRFVPECWFERATRLDAQWFENCRRLNKARNTAAHHFRLNDRNLLAMFRVTTRAALKTALIKAIKLIVFEEPKSGG